MNHNEAFQYANEAIWIKNLTPIVNFRSPKKRTLIQKKFPKANFPEFKFFENGIRFLNRDINDFYLTGNPLTPYIYYKPPVMVEVGAWDKEFLGKIVRPRIDAQEKEFNRLIEQKDFWSLFAFVDERICFEVYQKLFNQIPDHDKYDIFKEIYSKSEYGFRELKKSILKKIFSYRELSKEITSHKLPKANKQGLVKIYRGMTEKSTPIDKSYSWTTNLSVATYFSTRFDSNGQIFEALIPIEKIGIYITDRNEFEVVLDPDDLLDVHEMDILRLKSLEDYRKAIDGISQYEKRINPDLFKKPKGVHGTVHTRRVLLLTHFLCYLDDVSSEDRHLLSLASVYHDIGREGDDKEEKHGLYSVNKVKELTLLDDVSQEDREIIYYIIENHCISDRKGFNAINNTPIDDKKRAVSLLKYFKDADGLERVRFSVGYELDHNRLRHETAKKMVFIAHKIYQKINQ